VALLSQGRTAAAQCGLFTYKSVPVIFEPPCIRLRVKYLKSCRILMKLEFLDIFSKNPQTSNFMKIRPVGAELFHADRQTDGQTGRHDEANSRFSQFCERAETFKFQILYE